MDTVSVACKLPNGVILRGFRFETFQRPVIGGGMREVKEAVQTGEVFKINGNAAPYAQPLLDAEGNPIQLEQSFAITRDVPKDFWDRWLEQNKDTPMVKHGLIFAAPAAKPLELRAAAKAHRDNRHGLEPIDTHPDAKDPRNPPRASKLRAGSISAIAKADVAATG